MPSLVPCEVSSYAAILKGEDGLRIERLIIGDELVVAALLVDGHGGFQAAAMAVDQLLEVFAEECHGDPSGGALSDAATRSFARLHASLLAQQTHTAGSTVTLCLINEARGELTVCNVGDSFALLVPARPTSGDGLLTLTENHRLEDNLEERARVQAAGGQLGHASFEGRRGGPLRAFPGGICCARGLGDRDCVGYLSPAPYTAVHPFPASGACVVIASDGVWDALSFDKVAKLVLRAPNVSDAAERIVSKAMHMRGLRDDITCVCLVSGSPPAAPSPKTALVAPDMEGLASSAVSSMALGSSPPKARPSVSKALKAMVPSALRLLRPQPAGELGTLKEPTAKAGMLFAQLPGHSSRASAAASAGGSLHSSLHSGSHTPPHSGSAHLSAATPRNLSGSSGSSDSRHDALPALLLDSELDRMSSSDDDGPHSPKQLFAFLRSRSRMVLSPGCMSPASSTESLQQLEYIDGVGVHDGSMHGAAQALKVPL